MFRGTRKADEQSRIYAELLDELQMIPISDLLWLESFRIRANEQIRKSFGPTHQFLKEMNELLDDLDRQAAKNGGTVDSL